MFASLFRRAEASVDNAIADFVGRVLIALPFIVALGFGAASLSIVANRTYGPEIGNLVVAAAFVVLGVIVAIVVKFRKSPLPVVDEEPNESSPEQTASAGSIFDNEQMMGILSSAAPILLPALLRTATKNWPLILAVAAGLYVFSLSDTDTDAVPPQAPQT